MVSQVNTTTDFSAMNCSIARSFGVMGDPWKALIIRDISLGLTRFDQIAESSDLPADRSTPLAIYCRSGNMSAAAVNDLEALGFNDIVELEGGFNAWVASGRPLEPAAA